MAIFARNWQIFGSLTIAAVLVIGAYWLATNELRPPHAEASTESDLLQAIATKDSDGDGLTDWEESLYGTDPNLVDTKSLGMSDSEAVAKGLIVPAAIVDIPAPKNSGGNEPVVVGGIPAPAQGSLTAKFAQNFFALYLSAKQNKGGLLTQEESRVVAQEAISQLADSIAPTPDFKTLSDLSIVSGGREALTSFAVSVEAVLIQHRVEAAKSELLYLEDLVKRGDASAVAPLTSIAKNYKETAAGLVVIPVPEELANDYLQFINAMARIAEITGDFARVEADPIATMLALGQYPKAVLAMGTALISINKTYTSVGVFIQNGAPGASFVNIIPNIAESQKNP